MQESNFILPTLRTKTVFFTQIMVLSPGNGHMTPENRQHIVRTVQRNISFIRIANLVQIQREDSQSVHQSHASS